MADTPPAQVTPPPTFGSPTPPPEAAPAPTPPPAPPEANPPAPQGTTDPAPTETPKEAQRIVPERYDLKVPENSYLDPKALERIESYAKTNKLTQEEASAFLNNQDSDVRKIMEEKKASWLEETRQDREIGGANLQRNVEIAKSFLDQHMAPELRQDLDRTGYGNNRHFMKFVLNMAKRSSNDQAVFPGQQSGGAAEKSTADLFYAETTSKGKY